jgi:hypothetical protein
MDRVPKNLLKYWLVDASRAMLTIWQALIFALTLHMENLIFVQKVIMMTPCYISSYNFKCLHRLMHLWCVVPPNAIRHSSQPKTEEQKAARRARDRLIYAKTHPIQKRSRKDSIKPFQSNSGNIILTDTTSVEARDVPLHEELDVHTTGNKGDTLLHVLISF